jgi:hypothetical protein
MKLLIVMYAGPAPQRVAAVLDAHRVHGFTEIDRVHGRGESGRVEGTRAWPGESTVLFTVVPDEQVDGLSGALRGLGAESTPGERLHVAVVPGELFF